ncbi:MAG: glycosyltransferase family 2 protein [Candidatus Saccharibacteria bacterium]
MYRKKISIIIPVYNEAGNIKWHYDTVVQYFKGKNIDKEIIYINDGSSDSSLDLISDIADKDKDVRFISFSRNFGKEAATTAGLRKSSGDAAVIVDADGQHPIKTLDRFIEEWNKGFRIVVGVRQSNTKEGFIKRYGSKLFYFISEKISDSDSLSASTDFSLIDRKVINEFNLLNEHNRITRGLVNWLGFKKTYVNFNSPERHSGKASYSYRKLLKLALHSFVSNSTKPLQITGILGLAVMLLSALASMYLVVEKYLLGDPLNLNITGSAILALFLSFLIGLILICQWLLAIYIESIHNETQNRPLYIIEEEN